MIQAFLKECVLIFCCCRYAVGTEAEGQSSEKDILVEQAYERLLIIFIIVASLLTIHWALLKCWAYVSACGSALNNATKGMYVGRDV